MIFTNLDLFEDNGGIYMIINVINNKFYIGSTNNFNRRFIEHTKTLKYNKSQSIVLQRAVNKYGFENFRFLILDICNDLSNSNLLAREQMYLDALKPQYNTMLNATKVGSIKTPEAIENQRQSMIKHYAELPKGEKSGNMKGIIVKNSTGEILNKYRSVLEFMRETGLSRGFITKRLKGLPAKNPKYRTLIYEEF